MRHMVHVCVYQPWRDGAPRQIQHFGSGRDAILARWTGKQYASVLHAEQGVMHYFAGFSWGER